jgi:SAM-dependent methyltransferase
VEAGPADLKSMCVVIIAESLVNFSYDFQMNTNSPAGPTALPAAVPAPSAWVTRHASRIPAGGAVLDVACGSGRHARHLAAQGFHVDAVDRDVAAFVDVPERVRMLAADLETGPWPFAPRSYAGVVVTNYLYRPRLCLLVDALADNGVLIYETFAQGNEKFGRPSRAEFLLGPGELLRVVEGACEVIAFEEGYVDTPKPAVTQRIAAMRRWT